MRAIDNPQAVCAWSASQCRATTTTKQLVIPQASSQDIVTASFEEIVIFLAQQQVAPLSYRSIQGVVPCSTWQCVFHAGE